MCSESFVKLCLVVVTCFHSKYIAQYTDRIKNTRSGIMHRVDAVFHQYRISNIFFPTGRLQHEAERHTKNTEDRDSLVRRKKTSSFLTCLFLSG